MCQVLELGGGSGANFEFVSSPVEWTVTEPNLCFAPYFDRTVKELGGEHRVKPLEEVKNESRNLWIAEKTFRITGLWRGPLTFCRQFL